MADVHVGAMNPAQRLHDAGQSLWLDSISRGMLRSGDLARYVSLLAVTGLTSNPTILGHAMAASDDYDDRSGPGWPRALQTPKTSSTAPPSKISLKRRNCSGPPGRRRAARMATSR
jgi:hypothetical protein